MISPSACAAEDGNNVDRVQPFGHRGAQLHIRSRTRVSDRNSFTYLVVGHLCLATMLFFRPAAALALLCIAVTSAKPNPFPGSVDRSARSAHPVDLGYAGDTGHAEHQVCLFNDCRRSFIEPNLWSRPSASVVSMDAHPPLLPPRP